MSYISMCCRRKRKEKDPSKRANSKRVPGSISGRLTWNTPFPSGRIRHRTQARNWAYFQSTLSHGASRVEGTQGAIARLTR